MLVEPQEAYILHLRPFSDSKVLIEFITRSLGRVKTVGRLPNKKDRWQFQAFQPLLISFRGESDLKTLTHSEVLPNRLKSLDLHGTSLFCGMYVNELVQRVTPLEMHEPTLFSIYEETLETLAASTDASARERVLRSFELALLSVLGYQINFSETSCEAVPIAAEKIYRFDSSSGFTEIFDLYDPAGIKGEWIIAVGEQNFSSIETLGVAKKITRTALRPLLGNRPLKSRELFR